MPTTAVFAYLSAGCAGLLAFLCVIKARRSVPRWCFAAGMVAFAGEAIASGLSLGAVTQSTALHWQTIRLLALCLFPVTWLPFSLTYARGNGNSFLSRARTALAIAFAVPLGYFVIRSYLFDSAAGYAPDAAPVFRLQWGGMMIYGLLLITSVGVVMNLERTFRASVGTIRWRIKFMLLGVGVLFVVRIYTTSQSLIFRGVDGGLEIVNSTALVIATPLILRSFFRTGHFDLDVYPSQSVLQKSVTVLLAGAYLVIIGIFANAVTYFGGEAAFALKAFLVLVALVGLTIILQSDHARLRLRRFVSQHFQRPLYDYRTVWKKFTEATASCVEKESLTQAIATLVAEIFETLSVNVWVMTEKKDAFALVGSTSRRGGDSAEVKLAVSEEALEHFRRHTEPFDIEIAKDAWAKRLREHHAAMFPNGGHRICAPLVCRGELLGLISAGDRVGGTQWSLQDLEMLKCVADHAAASVMNAQLSQGLLQAKELEAFQAMAAFFVHDLKNAASTLNLMLQNLPVHYDNPEFRADALRGIAKTVNHINTLIRRLGQLRHELKVNLAESDFSEVVGLALVGLEPPQGTALVKDIRAVPKVLLDGEQFSKVITNLVLNAIEAVSRGGEVRVTTSDDSGWVVLTVGDNGCGMSEEFLRKSLFRPFQTSKTTGLGIGMFQSKMIVEAHGGRISVSSKVGAGTTFQVFLRAHTAGKSGFVEQPL